MGRRRGRLHRKLQLSFDAFLTEAAPRVFISARFQKTLSMLSAADGRWGACCCAESSAGVAQGRHRMRSSPTGLASWGDALPFEDLNWYCTILVSRDVDVPDLDETQFVFPRNAFDLADEAGKHAKRPLDLLTTVAASVVDQRVFSDLVLDNRVLLFATGRRAAGVPVLTAGAIEAQVTRGDESLQKLATRVALLERLQPRRLAGADWLVAVAHGRVQALNERDPWKQFQWAFTALEILTHKLFAKFRANVISRLRVDGIDEVTSLPADALLPPRERTPLQARFAVVAIALFPETAGEDTSRFEALKSARDALAHGLVQDEAELPVSGTLGLLGKYVDGAIKQLLFDAPSNLPWEDVAS